MLKNFESKNNLVIIFYLFLYAFLLVGFFYGEDPSGGSKRDYFLLQDHMMKNGFNLGVKNFLFEFYPYGTLIHSPIYYVLIHYLQNIFQADLVRLIILHLYLLVPIFFFKSLNCIYKNKNYLLFLIPAFFFIVPTFRSISIWSGRECFTLIFLSISFFYYSSFLNKKEIKNIYLSFFYLSLSSYISPEIGLLSILYLYEYFKFLNWKNFIKLLIFCFFLSIPFFYYYLNFLIDREYNNSFHINLLNNYPLFICAFLFYTFPFIFFKNLKNYIIFLKKNIFLIFLIVLTSYFLLKFGFNYNYNFGGGVVYRLLNMLGIDQMLFIFFSWGILNFIYLFKKNILFNILFLLIFIIQTCLNFWFFQKYMDLYWMFYFFFIFQNKQLLNYFKDKVFSYMLLLFYTTYYIGSSIYH